MVGIAGAGEGEGKHVGWLPTGRPNLESFFGRGELCFLLFNRHVT